MALTDGPSVVIPFDAHRRVVDWNQSGFQVGGLPFGQIQIALSHLAAFLHKKYNEQCIVLIDEYDAPFKKACEHRYIKSAIAVVTPIIRNVMKVSG